MAQKEASLLIKIKEAGADVLKKIEENFKVIKQAALGAFAAISLVIYKSISEYKEAESAQNELTQAMINAGVYSKELAGEYKAQAEALQKLTTYSDSQITAAQAVLQAQIGELKITPQLTKAVLDLAAAKKMDLVSAADLVGKSIGSATNALAKQGVVLDETASKTEKLSQVVSAINTKWGGQAEAAAKGLGALEQMQNIVNSLYEGIGKRLAPVIEVLVGWFKEFAGTSKELQTNISGFISVLQVAANTATILYTAFEVLGKVLGTNVAAAINATIQLLQGDMKGALTTLKDAVVQSAEITINSTTKMYERLGQLNTAFNQQVATDEAQETERLKQTLAAREAQRLLAVKNEAEKVRQQQLLDQQLEYDMIGANEEQALIRLAEYYEKQAALATSAAEKKTLILMGAVARDRAMQVKAAQQQIALDQTTAQARVNVAQGLSNLITAVAGQQNRFAFALAKSTAIAQAVVATNLAAAQALAVPPAPNFALAGLAKTAGALNVAAIAATAVQGLATGGVVPAQPGGKIVRLGEGGQDEAVIPLDRFGEFGGGQGGGLTFNVYGGMLGDEASAYQFMKAIDLHYTKLRQNNDSQAFDRIS